MHEARQLRRFPFMQIGVTRFELTVPWPQTRCLTIGLHPIERYLRKAKFVSAFANGISWTRTMDTRLIRPPLLPTELIFQKRETVDLHHVYSSDSVPLAESGSEMLLSCSAFRSWTLPVSDGFSPYQSVTHRPCLLLHYYSRIARTGVGPVIPP